MNRKYMVAVLLFFILSGCKAGIKSCFKQMFCCCMQQPQEDEFSITPRGTDESLYFLDAVGADDLTIRRIPIDEATEEELRSGNVGAAMFKRVYEALQVEWRAD